MYSMTEDRAERSRFWTFSVVRSPFWIGLRPRFCLHSLISEKELRLKPMYKHYFGVRGVQME